MCKWYLPDLFCERPQHSPNEGKNNLLENYPPPPGSELRTFRFQVPKPECLQLSYADLLNLQGRETSIKQIYGSFFNHLALADILNGSIFQSFGIVILLWCKLVPSSK